MGPQGTGGLCVRPGVEIRPFKVGGTGVQTYLPQQPREYPTRLEAGTLNGHGIAGLMAAMDYIRSVGRETIRSHELALARRFYEGAANTPGVTVYGDFSSWNRAPIVTLNIRDYDSSQVIPVPREITADCGLAWRGEPGDRPRLEEISADLETAGFYEMIC